MAAVATATTTMTNTMVDNDEHDDDNVMGEGWGGKRWKRRRISKMMIVRVVY